MHGAGSCLGSAARSGGWIGYGRRGKRVSACSGRPPAKFLRAPAGRRAILVRQGEGRDLDAGEIERLLGRCSLGDREAFRRLYDLAAPKLFGVACRILGHRGDAEEATQEAFVRIWQKAGRFEGGRGSGPGWIVAIARNAAIDRLRMRKAPTRDIADMLDLADPGPTPEASAAAAQDRRRIEACLGQLPPDRAQAVRGAYLEGQTYDDLARRFEVPLNTMRTWLRRSLIALRACLES